MLKNGIILSLLLLLVTKKSRYVVLTRTVLTKQNKTKVTSVQRRLVDQHKIITDLVSFSRQFMLSQSSYPHPSNQLCSLDESTNQPIILSKQKRINYHHSSISQSQHESSSQLNHHLSIMQFSMHPVTL